MPVPHPFAMNLKARHPPFSLPVVAASHGWAWLPPFAYDAETEVLTTVTHLAPERVVELVIRPIPGGVRVTSNPPGDPEALTAQLRWMLGLDQDLGPFYRLAREEPRLAHVVARAEGRLLRSPTLFEDAIKTLLTTNTTWQGTTRMVTALVEHYGAPHPADQGRRAFPTPARLAACSEAELRERAGLGYRAPYALELAQAVAAGTLDLERLKSSELPTAELRRRLLALRGIGAYAAAHLLMLLERYDAVPVDSWARRHVSELWHGGEPVTNAQVTAAFERWGRWQGLAYWFWAWDADL